MNLKSLCVFALLCIAVVGCKNQTNSNNKNELERLIVAAGIGNDPDLSKLILGYDSSAGIGAPADMCAVVTKLADKKLRGRPAELTVNLSPTQIGLEWSATILHESEVTLAPLDAEMTKQGYEVISDSETIAKLINELDHLTEQKTDWVKRAYRRTNHEFEYLVLAENKGGYTGGSIASGTKFQWHATKKLQNDRPALGELLRSHNGAFWPNYLSDDFYNSIADENVNRLSTGASSAMALGSGISIWFANDCETKMKQTLEAADFDFEREDNPRNGSTQKTWQRWSDATYAHVIQRDDSRTLFMCQVPQHAGPPRDKTKRLPTHPALKLPRSKRPLAPLEKLEFETIELKNKVAKFHEFGESIAGPEAYVRRYADNRNSNTPKYSGIWSTTENTVGSHISASERPTQRLEIRLEGPSENAIDGKLNQLSAKGTWAPLSGWCARISYRNNRWSGKLILVEEKRKEFPVYFGSAESIKLDLHALMVSVPTTQGLRVKYRGTGFPDSTEPGFNSSWMKALCKSPEEFRKTLLNDLELVRRHAKQEISAGENTIVVDSERANIREVPPPPPEFNELANADELKIQCKKRIDEVLDARQTMVKKHYKSMHEAVTKAISRQTVQAIK